MKNPFNPTHKIFHPKQWRDINWVSVYQNRKQWKINANGIQSIFLNPIRSILNLFNGVNNWLITIAIVLKYELNFKAVYYLYALPVLFIFFVISEIFDRYVGFHPRVEAFFQREKQIDRERNDKEFHEHLRITRDMHNKLFK